MQHSDQANPISWEIEAYNRSSLGHLAEIEQRLAALAAVVAEMRPYRVLEWAVRNYVTGTGGLDKVVAALFTLDNARRGG
jgi:hypothetical protein